MSDIESRLARLEDEKAILNRLYAYGHSIDYGHEEVWVDCFTQDGVWDARRRSGSEHNTVCRGRAELAAFIRTHTRAPMVYHKHMLSEPMITVEGDHATCDSYFIRLDVVDDSPTPRVSGMGRYRDKLRRCEDGVWRFSERIAEIESL
ncbi:nuclear transport factor 2 family protein [Jatrophihabitans sp. DSM 45814]